MLKTLEPILYVRSIEEAVEFYRTKLGFELSFAMHGPDGRMMYASVRNGDVCLMLGHDDALADRLGGGAEMYISAQDVDRYYEHVRAAGVAPTREIADQFWGDRTFTVTDPDGYVLTFAQTVREFDPARDLPAGAAVV